MAAVVELPAFVTRIFVKEDESLSLTVRNGVPVLAPTNYNDKYQHWVKDKRYSPGVTDEEGFPSFALVNEATWQAIRFEKPYQAAKLVPYKPEDVDVSILWTEGKDIGEEWRYVRMANNVNLILDGLHDIPKVHDGTVLGIWGRVTQDNQIWKIKRWKS